MSHSGDEDSGLEQVEETEDTQEHKTNGQAPLPQKAKKYKKLEARDMNKYVNKQRTLIFSTRGISNRDRHLMNDLRDLLPHSKKENKLDAKDKIAVANEVCVLKNCNNCLFFEARKRKDLYLWVAKAPSGPSIKFGVENVHTMAETKMTGNCLKASRPFLSFDAAFEATPQHRLMKELLCQAFGTPKGHPKSQPFIDHVFSFFLLDNRVWFRNFQVVYNVEGPTSTKTVDPVLIEIGPRFVLNPIRIFAGSFSGATLWENPEYISPNHIRSAMKRRFNAKYDERINQRKKRRVYEEKVTKETPQDPTASEFVFAQE